MLEYFVKTLDGVDEAHHGLYVKGQLGDDQGYLLEVKGAVSKGKLDEFRTNNTELMKNRDADRVALETSQQELASLKSQYEGVDMKQYQAVLQQVQDGKERDLLAKGDIEGVVGLRVGAMRQGFEEESKALKKARDSAAGEVTTLRQTVGRMRIDDSLDSALNETGARLAEGAREDMLGRVHRIFQVDDQGSMVPRVGDSIVRGEDGEPLTMVGFIQKQSAEARHLFAPAGGGGAGGDDKAPRVHDGKIQVSRSKPRDMATYSAQILSGEATVVP